MLRNLLESGEILAAPGVFDGFSAMMAQRSGFRAVYMGGYCVAASRFGLPDVGLIGLAEMLDAMRMIRRVSDKPLIADGDTGYGGLINVQHTVREYEAAGANAIHLEDQEAPKRCGHTKGKRVIAAEEAAAKIAVAVEARRSDAFLIIARTDSRQMHDIDEAIRRVRLYQEAGADLLFIDAPESVEEVERIAAELRGPLVINMTPQAGFATPDFHLKDLEKMGFALALYPGLFASPFMGAMERALAHFATSGVQDPQGAPQVNPHELVGFPAVWADEERWAAQFKIGGRADGD